MFSFMQIFYYTVFSQAGLVYEEHGNRILPENAETLLLIKGNYAQFRKDK